MSRRRRPIFLGYDPADCWMVPIILRPVELARRERVRRQVQRVKRRAARRWTA